MEEASGEPQEVWPDNLEAVNVFIAMLTQWRRAGMAGERVGLDYGVLPEVMRLCGVPPARRAEVFEDVRVLEDAALEKIREGK